MRYIKEKAPSVKSKVKQINKKIGKLVSKKEDAINKAKELADSEEPSGKMQASLAKIQLRQSESEAEKLMLQKQAEILKGKIDTAKKKEKTTKDIDIEEMENRPITILEGVMSDIHHMISNHKNFDSFQKEFFKEYGHKKVMKKTPEFLEWLEALYTDSQFAVAEADAKPGPDPYMRGLGGDEEEKKAVKMKKQAEMEDDDPDAYKELPGDKEAKDKGEVKTSKHVKKYHELYGDKKDESVVNEDKAEGDRGKISDAKIETALKTKAEETGVPIALIRIIMRRGMAAWKTGHRPGATEQQWGYARVNAFLTKGDGTWGGADKDVAKEVRDGGHDKGLKEGVESEIGLSDKLGKFKHSKPSKESESPNNITCGNCSWTWLKQDGGDDMYTCHKCGTDNAPSLGESMINEEDTYNDYPAAAKKNAKKALDWRDEHGRDEVDAGTAVGWTRANQLAKGEKISADTVKRMASFNRHRKNSSIKPELKATPWKDKGHVSWLIWGGDEGVDWAMKKSKEIDNMKESKQMRYIKPLTEGIYAKQSKIQPGEYIQTQYGYFYKRVEGQVGGQDAYVEIKKGKEGKKKTSIHDTVDFNIVDKSIALDESLVTEASEDRMIKQIERALKDGTSIFKLPMATQKYYNKNKSDFESVVTEGMSKSAIKKAIKVIDQQIEDEVGGDGEPLDNETLQALEQERERLLGMNESKFSPKGYAQRVVDGTIKIKDAMKEAGISLGNMAKLIAKIDKSFDVNAAFLEKNVMQNDPEKYVESRKNLKFVKHLHESFINDKDISDWEKEHGNLPIPKKIIDISKDMAKEGFIRKATKSVQAKLWIGLEGKSWMEMKDQFGDIVGTFYGSTFYTQMTDTMSERAAYYAYSVSMGISDKVANDEEIEPAYYEMKEYFNAFGMDYGRSRIFDRAVSELESWMKKQKITTL